MKQIHKGVFEKIINLILNFLIVIFGILLIISIYNNIQTKLLKNSYSSFFGYSIFEVQTGSMADTINIGDWIIVKYQRAINLDDIITYEQNGNFITHRVVEVYKESLVTKGDYNNSKDKPINKKQVIGKVIKILPNFGILRKTLFNPIVLITLIITFYLSLLVYKSKKQTEKRLEEKGSTETMKNLIDKLIEVLSKFKNKISKEDETEKELIIEPLEKEKKEEIKSTKDIVTNEEDLDKTMFFRMVSVEQDEIDNVYKKSKIKNKVPQEENIKKIIEKKSKKENKEIIKDVNSPINLKETKKKKFKNILDKTIYLKTEEISELVEILNQREKNKPNEATIKKIFLKSYIDGKYYNHCGDINVSYNGKNMTSKINLVIKDTAADLIKNFKQNDSKYIEKVNKYEKIFTTILYLEQAYLIDESIEEKRKSYQNKILKYLGNNFLTEEIFKNIIDDLIKTQNLYNHAIKSSFEKLDTNMFQLNLDNIISKTKKIYFVELKHNIAFSKIYSDYIVDKTYKEGIVAEDKIYVILTLLLRQIANDILNCDFNKKYILYFKGSLFEKEKKLYNILKSFDDEFAKLSIVILVNYEDVNKYSKIIKNLIKEGYHFATNLENTKMITVKTRSCIELMDYLFISRKNKNKDIISSSLSENCRKKFILTEINQVIENVWGD